MRNSVFPLLQALCCLDAGSGMHQQPAAANGEYVCSLLMFDGSSVFVARGGLFSFFAPRRVSSFQIFFILPPSTDDVHKKR